jgi:hypothetical protein
MHGPLVLPGHLAELAPQLLPGYGGFSIPKMSWVDLCYGTATNPLYGLEPLTAVREMGCQDPVISYFLLRGGQRGAPAGVRGTNLRGSKGPW